jgi:hypothetical protein
MIGREGPVADLPAQYHQRYREDLLARLPDLFGGEGEGARQTRRRYWSLVADLAADRYFGRLERWCAAHRVASSGHALAEENLAMHPPVDGNTLRALQRMHIPGIDILSSNPALAARSGAYCLTGALAASAATLNGTRRVMSETSDHSERMAGKPVSLEWMLACAAYQYAFGVTEFTLYYSPQALGAWYPAYCAGVGRLGALPREARRLAPLALYYPIRDVWTHYRPTEQPLATETQPKRLQEELDLLILWIFNIHPQELARIGQRTPEAIHRQTAGDRSIRFVQV